MKELAIDKTKLFPNKRVEKTNEFIKVLEDDEKKNKDNPARLSPK